MKRVVLFLLVTIFLAHSCKKEEKKVTLAEGDWWAMMEVDENVELPFTFTLFKQDEDQYKLENV